MQDKVINKRDKTKLHKILTYFKNVNRESLKTGNRVHMLRLNFTTRIFGSEVLLLFSAYNS